MENPRQSMARVKPPQRTDTAWYITDRMYDITNKKYHIHFKPRWKIFLFHFFLSSVDTPVSMCYNLVTSSKKQNRIEVGGI